MSTGDFVREEALSAIKAHDRAMALPIGEVVAELIDLLGATTVATLGDVNETRAVHQWVSGREPQRPNVLRFALQLALMISTVRDKDVARAWFQGSNPHLEDAVPALLLRNKPLADVQVPLMAAARAFAARK